MVDSILIAHSVNVISDLVVIGNTLHGILVPIVLHDCMVLRAIVEVGVKDVGVKDSIRLI